MEVVYPHSLLGTRTIHKRYSDFHHLRAELLRENLKLDSSPSFPSKSFFGSNLDQKLIERRLEGLQEFLGTVLEMKDLKKSKAFHSFLNIDSNDTKMVQ